MNIACVIREQRRWGLNGLLTRFLYCSEGRGGLVGGAENQTEELGVWEKMRECEKDQ